MANHIALPLIMLHKDTLLKTVRYCLTLVILALVFLWLCLSLSPKPPLSVNNNYSQALFDDKGDLLRLTLAPDGQYRVFTPLSKISPLLIKATLLQEDRYFYSHPGVNPVALVRASLLTFLSGHRRYGASTISMQLARLLNDFNTHSVSGKIKQIYYALLLEYHYSKSQILEAYLNLAPYGGNISGAGAASLIYYSRSPQDLNLSEATALSVIPQNPNKRKPNTASNYNLLHARNHLFERWQKAHEVTKEEQQSFHLPLQVKSINQLPFHSPHYADKVFSLYPKKTQIRGTINLVIQQQFEDIIAQYIQQQSTKGLTNAAALLIDNNNMQVKAMVGSADYFNQPIHGQVNGVYAKRSPGSTLKPFIFALAIEQGLITPQSILLDIPENFNSYSPSNYDNQYLGPISAENALLMSRNIPAIKLASQLKPNLYDLLTHIDSLSLKSKESYGLSIALGSASMNMVEIAELYAMLANGGVYRPIELIQTKERGMKRISKNAHTKKRLLTPEASFITLNMLSHMPQQQGFQLPVAWKTGTSSGLHDAWTVGNFSHYTLVVWIGNFDGKSNGNFIGQKIATPLFFRLIKSMPSSLANQAMHGLDNNHLNVITLPVCKLSGKLPTPNCPVTIPTDYIPGVSPIAKDTLFQKVKINQTSGLRLCGPLKNNSPNTQDKVFAIIPPRLIAYYRQAGLKFQSPPPYEPHCYEKPISMPGNPPTISSPHSNATYKISSSHPSIALMANAESKTLYWFSDGQFIGHSKPSQTLRWTPGLGKYNLQVMDELGHLEQTTIIIK